MTANLGLAANHSDPVRGSPAISGAVEPPHRNVAARQFLRSGTSKFHDRVDQAFGRYDLTVRAQYVAFLRAQSAAIVPVEAAINHGPWQFVLQDWPARRRSGDLLADLMEVGKAYAHPAGQIELQSPAEVLGAIYVLEGSRLGGRLLLRSVPIQFPRRFLSNEHPQRWRTLIEVLDAALVSGEQRSAALDAACRVFSLFETGATNSRKDVLI